MSDLASFDRKLAEEYFGSAPMCLLCGMKRAMDLNHSLKRMPPKGFSRKLMSSLYNLSPLCRSCHMSGTLHRHQSFFLRQTLSHLNGAQYGPDEIDKTFLEVFKRFYKVQ